MSILKPELITIKALLVSRLENNHRLQIYSGLYRQCGNEMSKANINKLYLHNIPQSGRDMKKSTKETIYKMTSYQPYSKSKLEQEEQSWRFHNPRFKV